MNLTREEFDARMNELDRRIDAVTTRMDKMAGVNEYLVIRQEQAWSALQTLEANQNRHLEILISMDESQDKAEKAIWRLDDIMLAVADRSEMLGGSFVAVFDALVEHIRNGHDQPPPERTT